MRDENGKRDGNPECRQIMIWVRFERGRSWSSVYYMRNGKSKQMSLLSEQKLEHPSLPQLYFIIHDYIRCNYELVCIAFLIVMWPY